MSTYKELYCHIVTVIEYRKAIQFTMNYRCKFDKNTHSKIQQKHVQQYFSYIVSVISWRSVLLVEETGVPRENHTCRKSLTNFIT